MVNNGINVQPGSPHERLGPAGQTTQPGSKWQRLSLVIQIGLSLAVVAVVLAFLLWNSAEPTDVKRPTSKEEVVRVVGPRSIRVQPNTPVDAKLQIAAVERAWLTAPVLSVTGMTLASLRPGKEESQDAWQFASSDLLSAFSDWQLAVKDVTFQKTQLKAIRDLNDSKIEAQKILVARMEKLVAAGTDTEKDLVAERTNLIQFEIQGRKDVHDQEQAFYMSERKEATLARQLQQAGLEPTMLRSAAAEGDIVVAEVPELVMSRVKLGMTCEVRFFAIADRVFTGKVSSISPLISKDKRVLNVQFTVKDPDNLLRPGMFADIGLGTDKRQALLMPADGVLHVGDNDYALLRSVPGTFKVVEIQAGQVRGLNVEVLGGLKEGDRVIAKGAILLKPVVVRALQMPVPLSPKAKADGDGGG